MRPGEAARHLQRMHETQLVARESIIAWYTLYRHKLPSMSPERSELDLIRTVALWMRLTDRGGVPEFPYEYRSTLSFPEVISAQTNPRRPNPSLPIGGLLLLGGLIAFFVHGDWALLLLAAGAVVLYLGYKSEGGASNPYLMIPGSTLYTQEGKRVLEWASLHHADD